MLTKGRLRDLLRDGGEGPSVAKNVLDLPLGYATVAVPPLFQDISTDSHTYNIVKHLLKIRNLADVKCWGTGSTRDALSWFHFDDEGFLTVVWVQAGSKYWVLANRLKEDHRWDEMSNIDTLRGWDVSTIDEDHWELEAVQLDSSCVLSGNSSISFFSF